ncbi:hypothetical protein [Streptomyces cavernae]|nr:hypothetical protein [Streptomyces cavernae]
MRYRDVLETAHAQALAELPQPIAQLPTDADQGVRPGGLYTGTATSPA